MFMNDHAVSSPAPGGRWCAVERWRPQLARCGDGAWRAQVDPGTGVEFAQVLDMEPAEVVEHAERVRAQYISTALPDVAERAQTLRAMAEQVEAAAEDLGELDALCTGKLATDGAASARAGAAVLRYYAELISEDPYHAEPDSGLAGVRQTVDRVPVGVGACILPWNFPLSQACARLAMLLAAGNAGIYKGSELAQPSLLALEQLAIDAGLPTWAFSVVTGGPEAGRALIEAPQVDAVCFTGGVSTGLAVAQSAMRSLKRLVLELGGKTPFVVFADADRDAALEVGLRAAFHFQGQACNAGSLLMVECPVYDEFLERFARRAGELRIGHQLAADTDVGPVISAAARDRIAGMVQEAARLGAKVHTGGQAPSGQVLVGAASGQAPAEGAAGGQVPAGGGFFYPPTVLSEVPASAAAATEEIFGPVVIARPFDSEAEIVERVNGSEYGLAAAVWTSDPERAGRLRESLRTGQLYLNTHGQVPPNVPWGGFRLSGLGRLYGRDGLFAFTEARSTYEVCSSYPARRAAAQA
jgi:acyl-CoA reductase-like NAD-dependent aldehyde dehydrogenase